MATITLYLAMYIVSIFWCKWCWGKCINDLKDQEIFETFNEQFVIKFTSWFPIGNTILAILMTYDLIKDKYDDWKIKRSVKNMLKKVSDKHKGEQVAEDINKIINQL